LIARTGTWCTVVRFDREQAAIRRGDLRDALKQLGTWDPSRFSREERRTHRLLLSEVLLLTADPDEAVRLAAGIIADGPPADVLARAQLVRGIAFCDAGALHDAVPVFRKAVAAAMAAESATTLARVQVRMVSSLAERLDASQLAAVAPDVRQNVVRAGDPHLTAYFYVTESRIAARAGAIDEAWRHLDLAAALLPVEPNHMLDGLHAFASAALCSVACRYTDAVFHGRRALHHARIAGYGRLIPRALGNLALALLHLGHVREAETLLDEALATPAGAETEIAQLDSKAQLRLLERDVDGCRDLLARIADLDRGGEWTWAALARQETRVRLLLETVDHRAAADVAQAARLAAQVQGDRVHFALYSVLEAEAHLQGGDPETARDLLDASTSYDPSLPLALSIERARVGAHLARTLGDAAAWRDHRERLQRVVDLAGTARQRAALRQDDAGGPSPVGPPPPGSSPTLSAVGHVLACAGHPMVLAAEIAALLGREADVLAVRHVTRDEDGRVVAERMIRGERPASERPEQAWSLGMDREGRHELQVWAPDARRSTLSAISALVESATALVAARRRGSAAGRWTRDTTSEVLTGVFGTAMRAQVEEVVRAAGSHLPVLITGETGTGKELVARELHRLSRAATGPFVPFNCAAVPREMLESQLFGHRRGAFTGASADFGGVVSEAVGGTLFLDEIGELDVTLQPKLLRFLETGELQRLGESRPLAVDVRTLAATNANVQEMIRAGRFREDLFYRLNVISLHLPPLRDRRDDIAPLARYFLDRFGREYGKRPMRLSPSAMELLTHYEWPGNVRELLNEMRRLTAYGEPDELITPERLSRVIRSRAFEAARRQDEVVSVRTELPLDEALSAVERAFIARAFKVSGGRVGEAAALLGVSRKGLFLMRKRLGLD
jgi:DNA-binding NtrC family response regulator/tetratricopeptide (TPR) repeat protein